MFNYPVIPKCRAFLLKPYFLVIVCFLALYSCKKDPKQDNSAAIIGKWLLTKETARVYSASGALVKDTTGSFGFAQASVNSYQTFNMDGSGEGVSFSYPENYTYAISGNALTIYPGGNHTAYNLFNIILVDKTNMQLESVTINTQPSVIFGLDLASDAKLVTDDYYTRE